MGTRSKVGYNHRCTVRGPLNPVDLSECLNVIRNEPGTVSNHDSRRAARLKLRRHVKHVRKHVPDEQRSPLSRELLKLEDAL